MHKKIIVLFSLFLGLTLTSHAQYFKTLEYQEDLEENEDFKPDTVVDSAKPDPTVDLSGGQSNFHLPVVQYTKEYEDSVRAVIRKEQLLQEERRKKKK